MSKIHESRIANRLPAGKGLIPPLYCLSISKSIYARFRGLLCDPIHHLQPHLFALPTNSLHNRRTVIFIHPMPTLPVCPAARRAGRVGVFLPPHSGTSRPFPFADLPEGCPAASGRHFFEALAKGHDHRFRRFRRKRRADSLPCPQPGHFSLSR